MAELDFAFNLRRHSAGEAQGSASSPLLQARNHGLRLSNPQRIFPKTPSFANPT